jgi:hypothetical protein
VPAERDHEVGLGRLEHLAMVGEAGRRPDLGGAALRDVERNKKAS